MAAETDDPTDAAARLEAALQRIAQAASQAGRQPPDAPAPDPALQDWIRSGTEIAERLDMLIAELRAALAPGRPG